MFSRSLAKDVKSLKNQFLNISKIHPWHCGCIRVSEKAPHCCGWKKPAIPASHPLEADVPSLPRLVFILQHSWIAKKLYRFLAFPEKMRSRGAVLNRIFLPVLYICSVLPYPWTWYISFNVAVSYIYPNYSDLTRPHPKWRCGRGTPPTTGLISGKSRLVKYYNSPRFEFKQVLIVLLKLNIFNKIKLSSSLTTRKNSLNMTIVKVVGSIHFFYPWETT